MGLPAQKGLVADRGDCAASIVDKFGLIC